jgi:HEAT repeat protein
MEMRSTMGRGLNVPTSQGFAGMVDIVNEVSLVLPAVVAGKTTTNKPKIIMKSLCQWILAGALMSLVFNPSMPLLAGTTAAEDKLIADLSSPDDQVVARALLRLEKQFYYSTQPFPMAKKLLADSSRPVVQRKASRYLGAVHAKVDETDLKYVYSFLTSTNSKTVIDGLKTLRGLEVPQAVPQIIPCLKNSDPYVMRDACRTLAVLGNKDVIPSIEPLLKDPDPKVQKDAQDAINALKPKP